MKKVFSRSSVIPCDLAKSVLDAAGVFAVIRHELGSAAAGYSWPVPNNPSLPWAWPEVWVSDEDFERAREILADVSAESARQMEDQIPAETSTASVIKRCPYCGKEYPENFTTCPVDGNPLVRS
jgi:cytochrome c556